MSFFGTARVRLLAASTSSPTRTTASPSGGTSGSSGSPTRAVYKKLDKHKSASYLLHQVKAGNTTPVIPTNLFLYFAAK